MNKAIHRDPVTTTRIFDNRTVEADYSTLVPILRPGLRVLDVGCGTGAISAGIAHRVQESGHVTGIDNTEQFISSGRETYRSIRNLELVHADLFEYNPEEKFDLIVSARVLQWLSNPMDALSKMKTLLKPGGLVSVLDYNHTALSWTPQPPQSMLLFYDTFLKWRAHAGMNNQIADDLAVLFSEAGFHSIEVFNADEVYRKGDENFIVRAGIWSKVAGLKQMVDEEWIDDGLRLRAIEEYDSWVETHAESMTMKLNEVRGRA
jgi:ubiquinone/menaquinone biosynthesis C-methylase UbiE